MTLTDTLRAECDTFLTEVAGTPRAAEVRDVKARLDEPIRIAVAGRVKAGKSTLLNALIGERLAATDAGECTRIPTWYRHGDNYRVVALRRDGEPKELQFTRDEGKLEIDLGFLAVEDIERIDVEWPVESLRDVVLIDTPGLASLDDRTSVRTRDLLGLDGDRASEADAVLYCLRHLHKSDAEYLGAFMDRSVAGASAANAVALVTRADEIGAARPDALESATRIAARYAADPRVRAMCSAVVPVAGLMAETGRSLREDEVAVVRDLAGLDVDVLTDLLISADRFATTACPVPEDARRELLERLGIFGVRVAVDIARTTAGSGHRLTAAELGIALLKRSGLLSVDRAVTMYFEPQAEALKARSALVGLREVAHRTREDDEALGERQLARLEAIEAAATDLLATRLRFLLASGEVVLSEDELAAATRLVQARPVNIRLGLAPQAERQEQTQRVLATVEIWRAKSGGGLLDPVTAEVTDGLVRVAEDLHRQITEAA